MKIFESIKDITKHISELKEKELSIGFVPTMGALHEGHLSLIQSSINSNHITVVSIFVNPIQFNNKNDLINYPRDIEGDIKKLQKMGCDIVFCPSEQEIYPQKVTEKYDLGKLDRVMEGSFRPGHFQGVAIVVKRLFDIIKPHNAYFGKKDFQQLAIIKYLVKSLEIPVNIIGCKTVRDEDGLAKSSRNLLLDNNLRSRVTIIPQILFKCRNLKQKLSIKEIKELVQKAINETEGLKLEYFEMVDEETLIPIEFWQKEKDIVACIAVWAGKVRLIDNVKL